MNQIFQDERILGGVRDGAVWSYSAQPDAVSAETAGSVGPEDVNARLEHRPS